MLCHQDDRIEWDFVRWKITCMSVCVSAWWHKCHTSAYFSSTFLHTETDGLLFSTQFSCTQSVGMWYAGESQTRIIELTQTQGCPIRPSHLSYLSGARGYASLWRSPVQRCGCYRGNRPGRRPSPADEGRLVETEQRGEGKQIQTTRIKEQDITADPHTPACTNIII